MFIILSLFCIIFREIFSSNQGGQFQIPTEDQLFVEDSNSEDEIDDEVPISDEEKHYLDTFVAEDRSQDAEFRAPAAPEHEGHQPICRC